MRKLVLKMSVTADGFVGGPNGEIEWLLRTQDESGIDWIAETLWGAGLHIMGSRTFHDMAQYWPVSSEKLAAPMNEIPKHVFSRKGFLEPSTPELTTQAIADSRKVKPERTSQVSPFASTWENVPVSSDLDGAIKRLKKEDGKYILAHGGARFAQSLVKTGLIDEYRLVVHPVVIGKGLPLFSELPTPTYLKLESSTRFKSGTLANVYTLK